jgi:hypothetical protein
MCVGRSRTLAAMSRAQHRKKVDLWQQERQRCYGNMSIRASTSDADVTSSSLSEVAALDKLIDLLRGANGQQQLTQLVAENLLAFDQKFWIRLATRSDAAQSSAEKESLTNLANVRFHASSFAHRMHQSMCFPVTSLTACNMSSLSLPLNRCIHGISIVCADGEAKVRHIEPCLQIR